jgi:hypothetical protein
MANISKPTTLNQIWAATGTKIDPGTIKTSIGWVVQLPPYEYQNWAMNRQDTAIAHFNQHGIPEWDVNTEYQGNLSYSQGSNGFIYKCLQTHIGLDPTNTNNNLFWRLAFEEYGSVQVVQSALNAHLANYATLSGISNIVLARANLSVFSKAEGDTRYAFKGGDNATPFLVGTASNAQHAVPLSQINSLLVPATESTYGTTRYATISETETGTIDDKTITPLKASTIFLKKSGNLAGLGNVATSRDNLGLGSAAVQPTTAFLNTSNNLSDVPNKAVARSNLGLTSMAVADPNGFMYRNNNLNDVFDKQAARNNLQLGAHVTFDPNVFLYKNENLAGLTNPAQARINLGLSDSGLYPSNTWLIKNNNLADLTNVQAARNNLGLGNLSTRSVFGVPGNLDFTNVPNANAGYARIAGGMTLQWGFGPPLGDDQAAYIGFHIPGSPMSIQITGLGVYTNGVGPGWLTDEWTSTSFRVSNNYNSGPARAFSWMAMVYTG